MGEGKLKTLRKNKLFLLKAGEAFVAIIGTMNWIFVRYSGFKYGPWGAVYDDIGKGLIMGSKMNLTIFAFPCYSIALIITILVYLYDEPPTKLFILIYLIMGAIVYGIDGLIILIEFSTANRPNIGWLTLSILAFANCILMAIDTILTFNKT